MPVPVHPAAVVLAGGEGRRFGGDKIIALVDGKTSLERVVEAAWAAGASPILVAARDGERCRRYMGITGLDLICLDDPPGTCGGPGAALLAAAEAAMEYSLDRLVVVPGDSPWLEPRVVEALDAALGLAEAAAILHGDGFLESLLQAHRGEALAAKLCPLRGLCGLRGELRASDPLRLARSLALIGSGEAAASATSYAHINTREALRTRAPKNPLGEGIHILPPWRPRPRPGVPVAWLCGELAREQRYYEDLGIRHLARQAGRDRQLICGEAAGPGT